VRRGVDRLLHRAGGEDDTGFEQAVKHYRETVSIPIYPALDEEEIRRIVAATVDLMS
jgi:dTDP-4-amino-4,6-dideoxygalactose transaminase